MSTSYWRSALVTKIMVAKYIVEWCVIAVSQGREVLRRQVSTGYYQINTFNGECTIIELQKGLCDSVSNTENFHVSVFLYIS